MREDGADVDIVPVSATPVRECDCPPNPSGDHTEGCLTTGAMSDPAEVKTLRMTKTRVFTHNCQDPECLSERVTSVQTVKTPEGWTLVTAICADCGETTRYDTLSDYRFTFACSATEGTDDGR